MCDSLGLLSEAKDQIIILTSIKPFTEAAYLVNYRSSVNTKVAYVIAREQQVRAPCWLKKRIAAQSSCIELVFIRVDQIHVCFLKSLDHLIQRIGCYLVIIIQKSDKFAGSDSQSAI